MKTLRAMLLGLVFCMGTTYCASPPPKTPMEVKRSLVEHLEKTTVAFVRIDDDGDMIPYCSGVWVGQHQVLTAEHCVKESPLLLYVVKDDPEQTLRIAFTVDSNHDLDLALLITGVKSTPPHPIAQLNEDVWDGEPVHIVGHTTGLWWTYMEGVVSSRRDKTLTTMGLMPKSLQISSPVWFGNSGGGAFDPSGKLIGISSWISTRAPNLSFFIYGADIKGFLKKNQL